MQLYFNINPLISVSCQVLIIYTSTELQSLTQFLPQYVLTVVT